MEDSTRAALSRHQPHPSYAAEPHHHQGLLQARKYPCTLWRTPMRSCPADTTKFTQPRHVFVHVCVPNMGGWSSECVRQRRRFCNGSKHASSTDRGISPIQAPMPARIVIDIWCRREQASVPCGSSPRAHALHMPHNAANCSRRWRPLPGSHCIALTDKLHSKGLLYIQACCSKPTRAHDRSGTPFFQRKHAAESAQELVISLGSRLQPARQRARNASGNCYVHPTDSVLARHVQEGSRYTEGRQNA
jgi:hypothetical protein